MTPQTFAQQLKQLTDQVPAEQIDQDYIDQVNIELEQLQCAVGIKPGTTPPGSPTGGN